MEYEYGSYGVQQYGGYFTDEMFPADMPLVGSAIRASSEFCGTFSKNVGCLEAHLHVNKPVPAGVVRTASLDGRIHGLKALVYIRAFRCTNPLCPDCCLHWAKLQVARAMRRFDAFIDEFGEYDLDHIVVSVPKFDWGESYKFMRRQVTAMLLAVGAIGGMIIYHPKRYSRRTKYWYYSPHFHVISFTWEGRVDGKMVKELHNFSGYVLKKLPPRRSVYNTIMYQLSHAGIPEGRSHAVVWYGELNNRKVGKLPAIRDEIFKPRVCPVCGNVLNHVCRVSRAGSEFINYREYEDTFILDDVQNWTIVPKRGKKEIVDFDDG